MNKENLEALAKVIEKVPQEDFNIFKYFVFNGKL